MDTIILKSDFPSFPFGVKKITRDWILHHFKLPRALMVFKFHRINTIWIDSVFVLTAGKSKIDFHTSTYYNPIDSSYMDMLYDSLFREQNTYHQFLYFPIADIIDPNMPLDNDIRVGIRRDVFFRNLSITNVNRACDAFFITDEEWQTYHEFYFRADTLYRIKLRFMD